MRSTSLIPRKKYHEILWNDEQDKKEFFDTLKPMIRGAWKQKCPRYSEQRFAEMFVKVVLNEFWRCAWKEMIHSNRDLSLYRNSCRVGIHRLPASNNERTLKMSRYPCSYVPFFSRRSVKTRNLVYFQLKETLSESLLKEIKAGHTYRFGKPTY